MASICILAQFPPPMHGLSKAVETLYNSRLRDKYHFSKINITSNKKIFSSLIALIRSKSDIIYFTPSQTSIGNLRDLAFLKLIQWRKKCCIIHIHGGYYRQLIENDIPTWQRKMNYNPVRRLSGGIVLGESLRNIFDGLLPYDRIYVCPNCVDDKYIAKSISEKINNLERGGTLHVLYLSNFIGSKGYREVLQLAKMAVDNGDVDKFCFHFAGKFFCKTEEKYFNAHSEGLKNVVYHGVVDGQEKIDLMNQCQIFSLLSRYPNEGQPISILEAMGNGMAIITTDHAGIPEIASHKNGFVCSKQNIDVSKVYEYLSECFDNRKTLVEVCIRNYNEAKSNYTEEQYINNMDNIFASVFEKL